MVYEEQNPPHRRTAILVFNPTGSTLLAHIFVCVLELRSCDPALKLLIFYLSALSVVGAGTMHV